MGSFHDFISKLSPPLDGPSALATLMGLRGLSLLGRLPVLLRTSVSTLSPFWFVTTAAPPPRKEPAGLGFPPCLLPLLPPLSALPRRLWEGRSEPPPPPEESPCLLLLPELLPAAGNAVPLAGGLYGGGAGNADPVDAAAGGLLRRPFREGISQRTTLLLP